MGSPNCRDFTNILVEEFTKGAEEAGIRRKRISWEKD